MCLRTFIDQFKKRFNINIIHILFLLDITNQTCFFIHLDLVVRQTKVPLSVYSDVLNVKVVDDGHFFVKFRWFVDVKREVIETL